MTYVQTGAPRARFQFGETLRATFDAVFNNFAVFLMLALAISAVPMFLVNAVFGPATILADPGLAFVSTLLRAAVGLGSAALLQGALVRGVITHMNGRKPAFDECLRAGLSHAAPLVGIGILFGLAVGIGLVLLVVPGLFIIALWGVVAPVQVVERRGVFGSFSRSADLTEGERWGVLGVLVIMGLISLVAVMIGSAVIGIFGGLAGLAGGGLGGFTILTAALSAVAGALASIFSSAAPAAIYYNLRRSKEGAAPAELAAIFD